MMSDRIPVRRLAWALLAGTSALLLTVGLLLTVSHFRALAQPSAEVAVANLEVQKDVNTSVAAPGDTLIYTIRVWNTGGDPASAWLTDILPVELTFVTDSLTATVGTFGVENGVITWSHSTLGYQAWITFSAQISPEITYANVVNTAEVTGTGELLTDSASTEVGPSELEASKSVFPSSAFLGGQLAYTVRITNTGSTSVAGAWMTDDLPPEVNYVAGSLDATKGSWGEASDIVTWTGSLAPSEAVAVTFAAEIVSTLSEETRFTNTAEITGAGSLVTASVGATAITTCTLYLPIISHHWPPILFLNPIPTPGDNNSYIVSWSGMTGIDRYVLQEATDADFVNVTQLYTTTTETSQSIEKGATCGTYYYRVRADDDDRWGEGPWSNVESVSIGYFDDFSDSSSGWADDSGPLKDDTGETLAHWYRGYYNGDYRIYVENVPGPGPWDWFKQPDALAPHSPSSDKYCVETYVKFQQGYFWANMGVVFGADETNTKLYALCLSQDADESRLGLFLVRQDDYDFPELGCARPEFKIDVSDRAGTSRYGWNRVQVGVDGDTVTVYVGGLYKGQWTMDGLSSMTRVGVVGGTTEIPPIDIRFSEFRVVSNVACTP